MCLLSWYIQRGGVPQSVGLWNPPLSTLQMAEVGIMSQYIHWTETWNNYSYDLCKRPENSPHPALGALQELSPVTPACAPFSPGPVGRQPKQSLMWRPFLFGLNVGPQNNDNDSNCHVPAASGCQALHSALISHHFCVPPSLGGECSESLIFTINE